MNKIKLALAMSVLLVSNVALADLNTGLVAHWSFDDCTAKDISENGYDGVITGKLDCVAGIGNSKALRFKGAEYITTTYQQLNTTAYSVSAWVKIGKTEGGGILDNRGAAYSGATSLTLVSMANSPIHNRYTTNFGVHGDDIAIGKSSTKGINNNSWHHLVGTWSANSGSTVTTKQFNFFIDGVKVSTSVNIGNAVSPLSGVDYTTIGYYKAWESFFKGTIDDVRIYNRVLTDTEVFQLNNMNESLSGMVNGLQQFTVVCSNITTGESVNIPATTTNAWSCEKAGLKVLANQQIDIHLQGNTAP